MAGKFLFAFTLLALVFSSRAGAEIRPFADLWNNISYYDTNAERKGFSSLLGRFDGRLGIYLLDTPIQVYGVYTVAASQSPDYWDNSVFTGAGVRMKPFQSYVGFGWQDEWIRDLKIFYETLSASYLKDAVSGEANKRTDNRYGFDLWHEWNLDHPDINNFWGELWSNYSFRSTNFSWTDFDSSVFYFQPKLGRHLGRGIETYLRADLTASPKTDYWLNTLDYGLGIRFEPWRSHYQNGDSLLKKFKMFAEVVGLSYLKDKPADPNKTVASDVRFGVEFSYGR